MTVYQKEVGVQILIYYNYYDDVFISTEVISNEFSFKG